MLGYYNQMSSEVYDIDKYIGESGDRFVEDETSKEGNITEIWGYLTDNEHLMYY